jgi:hypothetical protein
MIRGLTPHSYSNSAPSGLGGSVQMHPEALWANLSFGCQRGPGSASQSEAIRVVTLLVSAAFLSVVDGMTRASPLFRDYE